jgi:hypothetical protein
MAIRMLQRRGTAAQWAAANPVLGDGEIGIEKDTGVIKFGDGETAWADLEIVFEATPAVMTVFGRTGDVTATSEDLTDQTAIGLALFTAADGDAARTALGFTAIGNALAKAADQAAARAAIGAGTGNGNGNVVGTGITNIVGLTATAYAALTTKDPTTLYLAVG